MLSPQLFLVQISHDCQFFMHPYLYLISVITSPINGYFCQWALLVMCCSFHGLCIDDT